jgi:hypothetical protein
VTITPPSTVGKGAVAAVLADGANKVPKREATDPGATGAEKLAAFVIEVMDGVGGGVPSRTVT